MTNKHVEAILVVTLAWVFSMLLMIILMFILGCSSPSHNENPSANETPRYDLKIKVDGTTYRGTGVLPAKPEYNITVKPEGRIDRIQWGTCHRQRIIDKPDTGWLNNEYEFKYQRTSQIEDAQSCALEVIVLEEKKTRNGFSLLEFLDARPEVKLPAKIKCNGDILDAPQGVSICQSAAGLVQEIKFDTPVVNSGASPECNVMETKDEKLYRFDIAKGKCSYYFVSNIKASNGLRLMHRLTTIGYTTVPVRQ